MADIARALVSCRFKKRAVESCTRRSVRVMKLVHCFLEALRLVENLNDEVASRDSSVIRSALGVAHLDSALLWRTDEYDVVLYIESAAAHTRSKKQNRHIGTASLLQEPRSRHSVVCDGVPLSFDAFLLTKTLQTTTFQLPVKKMYFSTVSPFSCAPADKKKTLPARTKACAQRSVCAVRKHFSLEKEKVPPAQAAEKSLSPSTPCDFRRLGKCASIQVTRLDPRLALRTVPDKSRRPSHPHEDYQVTNTVLGCKTTSQRKSSESHRKARGWKKSAPSA